MDLPADLETETMVGVRLSVPLPLWNRNQGEIAETTAARARAVAELEALRLKAQAEASSARKVMERLLPVLDESTGHLAPMAQQQIKLVRDGYSNNRASVQDVLRARDQLLMVEMSAIDALRDFHLARVRWMAATENRAPPKSDADEPRARQNRNIAGGPSASGIFEQRPPLTLAVLRISSRTTADGHQSGRRPRTRPLPGRRSRHRSRQIPGLSPARGDACPREKPQGIDLDAYHQPPGATDPQGHSYHPAAARRRPDDRRLQGSPAQGTRELPLPNPARTCHAPGRRSLYQR